MRFNDDFPDKKSSGHSELADSVADEHEKQLVIVAEQRIKEMHTHGNGSPVLLRELGAEEIFGNSQLEGKLETDVGKQQQAGPNYAAAKFDSAGFAGQAKGETLMMGCCCGAEWTVTGKSLKGDANPEAGIKIQQYVSVGGNTVKYGESSSEKQEYSS